MSFERLARQLEFITEIDKLKHIFRQTDLLDGSRKENDAEHSWHLAVMAVFLNEYAVEPVDLIRVIKMVLIHDIVEIDAGDTFCYDEVGRQSQREREEEAADRIFNILPLDQSAEIRELWEEFEEMETPEAKFAAAVDRLQPLMHNYHTNGAAWQAHGVQLEQALERNRHIGDGAPLLWEYAEKIMRESAAKGWLKTGAK